MFIRHEDGGSDPRLLDFFDAGHFRHVGGIVKFLHCAVGQMDSINNGRRRGDELEIEFTVKPLTNDFEMEKTQEAAAKAEAKSGRCFRLEGEACVVQMQFGQGIA